MAEKLRADVDRDVLRAVHDEGFEPPPYRCKAPPDTPAAAAAPPPAAEPSEAAAEPAGAYAAAIAPQPDVAGRAEPPQEGDDELWNPRDSLRAVASRRPKIGILFSP